MAASRKIWTCCAGLNGLIAVAMGAVAAHAVADPQAAIWAEKASTYQLIHAVVLLTLAERPGRWFASARIVFMIGMFLFCGSLYLRALTGWAEATRAAPAGGVCLMAGWLLIAVACYKKE